MHQLWTTAKAELGVLTNMTDLGTNYGAAMPLKAAGRLRTMIAYLRLMRAE